MNTVETTQNDLKYAEKVSKAALNTFTLRCTYLLELFSDTNPLYPLLSQVYERAEGSDTWTYKAKLTADDAHAGDKSRTRLHIFASYFTAYVSTLRP